MRKLARYILYLVIVVFVGGAILFVWAMQREIDVSTPEAREKQKKSMVLGCKVKLPDLLKSEPALAGLEVSTSAADAACNCAADRILETYAPNGVIRPTDVPEAAIDAAERDCLLQAMAPG
ncbi:hypothetical protein A8950_2501 [Dongia mobilis]|uniref:Uncharacterized protein n=1 Tax=Dongia mobilis TaxID=578943 RepID=A0A4R6WS43_9PROT|nr:hypothetical protein [Dongia mobilis]TDQ81433.1 hypothetical protein A8950_2501 [Dongia mobilis]